MRLVTIEEIEYSPAGTLQKFIIPAGTQVIPADNLPDSGAFWAVEWQNMGTEAESWGRNYGFLLDASDVREDIVGEVDSFHRAARANRLEAV